MYKKYFSLTLSTIALIISIIAIYQAFEPIDSYVYKPDQTISAPEQTTNDYYQVVSLVNADQDYIDSLPEGISYCPLDDLGRATCAVGKLTYESYKEAKTKPREQNIATPKGWPKNFKATIKALDIPESNDYNGYFYNRSHLIADSLGGSPEAENIVIGTRTQNVGSTRKNGQYAGGMAAPELFARNYLSSDEAIGCPLYYAVTPVYKDTEMLPRVVNVKIQNCNKSISNIYTINNTANGWTIDYLTGQATQN